MMVCERGGVEEERTSCRASCSVSTTKKKTPGRSGEGTTSTTESSCGGERRALTRNVVQLEAGRTTTTTRRKKVEQKGVEAKTRESLEAYRLLRTAIWVLDMENGRMWFANEAACELWEAESEEELMGRDMRATSESTKTRNAETMRKLEKGERVVEHWTIYPKEASTTANVRITMSPVLIADDDDNKNERLAVLAEGMLLESPSLDATMLRSLESLRHVPAAVERVTVSDEKIRDRNPYAIQVFGVGESFAERFEGNARDVALVLSEVKIESLLKTSSGSRRWFSTEARRSRDPSTGELALLVVSIDVHERKLCEESLRTAQEDLMKKQRTQAEFYAVMTHEIRTPLNSIVGHADLLAETRPLSNEQSRYLTSVVSSSVALMSIVNDLLDLSKLEAGKMSFEVIEFDLDDVVSAALDAVDPEAKSKHLELMRPNSNGLRVRGDPSRLRQILLNYLSNAVKFTSAGGRVSLSVSFDSVFDGRTTDDDAAAASSSSATTAAAEEEEDDDAAAAAEKKKMPLRFEVTDTGVGISPADQSKLFRGFSQTHESIARKFGGTGLGLSIVSLIAKKLGGHVGVQSELGKGATFFAVLPFQLVVPRRRHNAPRVPSDSPLRTLENSLEKIHPRNCNHPHLEREETVRCTLETKPLSTRGLHVLVVDDVQSNIHLLSRALDKLGHTYSVAKNGLEAIQVLETKRGPTAFDVVFMDRQMPVMDGCEATRRIRADLGLAPDALPIVGLTADFRQDDLDTYLAFGMTHCLGKPFRFRDLKLLLEDITSKRDVRSHLPRVPDQ